MRRPLSTTVVAWLTIVGFACLLLMVLRDSLRRIGAAGEISCEPAPCSPADLANLPDPATVELIVIAYLLCSILCGVGFFRGWNWSRWLFVCISAGLLLFTLVTPWRTMVQVVAIAGAIVIAVLLFLPSASVWFRRRDMK